MAEMSDTLRIYLSGSIRKGSADPRSDEHFWSEGDEATIRQGLLGQTVELLNPAKTHLHRNDFALNFGRDLYLVSISDVLLVDARTEKGIGVGAEMMFAVQRGLPVITWSPLQSHYRRKFLSDVYGEDLHNWTHPFIFGLSDYVVDTLDAAVDLIRKHVEVAPLVRRTSMDQHIQRYAASLGGANCDIR